MRFVTVLLKGSGMRLVKTFGLILVAALIASALAGAATAAAEEIFAFEGTVVCPEAPTEKNECPTSAYATGSEFSATASAASIKLKKAFLGVDVEVKCKSTIKDELTADGDESPLRAGKVTQLSFTECKSSVGNTCTATAVNTTYQGQFYEDKTSPGNGSLFIYETAGKGVPGITVVCEGAFKVNCTYSVNETNSVVGEGKTSLMTMKVEGGTKPKWTASEAVLKSSGSTCPGESPRFTSTYEVQQKMDLVKMNLNLGLTPTGIAFKVKNEEIELIFKNTEKSPWELNVLSFTGPYDITDPNKCKGKTFNLNDTCSAFLKCLDEKTGSLTFGIKDPNSVYARTITVPLKCG
jgi:hypothetical protein